MTKKAINKDISMTISRARDGVKCSLENLRMLAMEIKDGIRSGYLENTEQNPLRLRKSRKALQGLGSLFKRWGYSSMIVAKELYRIMYKDDKRGRNNHQEVYNINVKKESDGRNEIDK